jgi:Flp pilus assembly protein TadD
MDLLGAERIFTVAWYQRPDISTAPRMLTWILAEQGDALGAERWARRSLAIYEGDAERHHMLAWALAAQGRFEEGRRTRARADELGPTALWHAWVYNAYVQQVEGDRASALAMLDSAWADAGVEFGRAAVDAIRVRDFGLAPLLVAEEQDSVVVNR